MLNVVRTTLGAAALIACLPAVTSAATLRSGAGDSIQFDVFASSNLFDDTFSATTLPALDGSASLIFSKKDAAGDLGSATGQWVMISDQSAVVPVPAAGLLLLSALGGALALRRRKSTDA